MAVQLVNPDDHVVVSLVHHVAMPPVPRPRVSPPPGATFHDVARFTWYVVGLERPASRRSARDQ